MEFKIECPWCHQHYSVDDSFVGQNVECSVCGKVFTAKYPNDSTAEAALNPAENSIKQEKEDTSTISQDYSPKEPASERKKNIRKGFIIFVVFVFVLIALCGAYYSIALVKERKTEINLKNGIKAIDEHRYEDAVNYLQYSASRSNPEAQLLLGICLFNGDGIKRDYDEAVKWFRRAAEQNNLQAQFKLGVCYLAGVGVNPREEEALYWLKKSAEQGNHEAQIYLGDFYYDKGEMFNFSEAIKWYQKASKTGMLTKENEERIRMCITFLNAYSGDASEQLKVYLAYEGGLFCFKQDKDEANKWLVKAANSNNPRAQAILGAELMQAGNEEESLKWLKKAGEQGDANAMLILAQYYAEKAKAESIKGDLGSISATARAITLYKEGEKWLNKLQGKDDVKVSADVMEQPVAVETFKLPGGVDLNMVKVEAGTFEMSAEDGENQSVEVLHSVTLKQDFYIAQMEVTQEQWKAIMGNNPSIFKGDNLPVENVSWNDAMEFCKKMNTMVQIPEGCYFSLPTETQWEYAARGGNKSRGYKYSGSNKLNEVAWYDDNSGQKTHPVGQKKSNELGLYDMSGNVYEWCFDDWNINSSQLVAEFAQEKGQTDSQKARRGGCWNYFAMGCRSAFRSFSEPNYRINSIGFRPTLVMTEEGAQKAEEARKAEEVRKAEEARIAEETRKAEEARKAEDARKAKAEVPKLSEMAMNQFASTGVIILPGDVELQMVKIEAGTFEMGAKDGENWGIEIPHSVTLKQDFYIGQTEVTQKQWEAVMTGNPSNWKDNNLPVEGVSWNDAQEFCKKLNEIYAGKLPSGYRFDLPTEAQWEYAARGGDKSRGYKYSGSGAPDDVAWHIANSENKTHPVGMKQANELGLYDMSGNVAEWCRDWYEVLYAADPEFLRGNVESLLGVVEGHRLRVIRGGSWESSSRHTRVANRFIFVNDFGINSLGFRLALVPFQ